MVGRRGKSFRCWSTGKSDFPLPERGWRFAGLQIPSMAYPPSLTVSHFNQIFSISNLNDWLIADGVFFIIRRIQVMYLLFVSKRCSVEWNACIDLHIIDTSEMTSSQTASWQTLSRRRSFRNQYWVLLIFSHLLAVTETRRGRYYGVNDGISDVGGRSSSGYCERGCIGVLVTAKTNLKLQRKQRQEERYRCRQWAHMLSRRPETMHELDAGWTRVCLCLVAGLECWHREWIVWEHHSRLW